MSLPVCLWLPLAPLPRPLEPLLSLLLAGNIFLLFLSLPLAIAEPIATIYYIFKRRKWWIPWAICWAITWWAWINIRATNADSWRRAGLIRITQNAKPLVAAIEQYKTVNGSYPPNFAALTPRFIKQIPYTGAPGYPQFHYRIADDNSKFKKYELSVLTSKGPLNWDRFFYWPEQNYPTSLGGEAVEPIKDWAYLHE